MCQFFETMKLCVDNLVIGRSNTVSCAQAQCVSAQCNFAKGTINGQKDFSRCLMWFLLCIVLCCSKLGMPCPRGRQLPFLNCCHLAFRSRTLELLQSTASKQRFPSFTVYASGLAEV